jgi:hypothetical protein
LRAKDPGSRQAAADIPEVRIQVYPEPVRVNYKVVRSLVPKLWEPTEDGNGDDDGQRPTKRPDIMIHIGMAAPGSIYQIERRAHRTGYFAPDVDGEKLEDEFGDDETRHGPDWPWFGLPDELETDLDVPDVWSRWQQHSAVSLERQPSLTVPSRELANKGIQFVIHRRI